MALGQMPRRGKKQRNNQRMTLEEMPQERLQKRQAKLENKIARRQEKGKKTGRAEAKLAQVNQLLDPVEDMPNPDVPQTFDNYDQLSPEQQQDMFISSPMKPTAGLMDQIGQQVQGGGFQPQNYNADQYMPMRQQATDVVMGEFERQNAPIFKQQQSELESRLAERGIPVGSELYEREMNRLSDQQQGQRQSAQANAFQMGAQEQAQSFGQAYQGYQLPTQQVAALSPYYNAFQQGQQFDKNLGFQAGQSALDREHDIRLSKMGHKQNLAQIAATPRGGGGGGAPGLTYDQRLGLMDRDFYNNMVLQGMQQGQQMPLPNASSGFGQGLGTGVGAGLATALAGSLR